MFGTFRTFRTRNKIPEQTVGTIPEHLCSGGVGTFRTFGTFRVRNKQRRGSERSEQCSELFRTRGQCSERSEQTAVPNILFGTNGLEARNVRNVPNVPNIPNIPCSEQTSAGLGTFGTGTLFRPFLGYYRRCRITAVARMCYKVLLF